MGRLTESVYRERELKTLAAIRRLKRAIGVPNHPRHKDSFSKEGVAHIYTQDGNSADILNALFHQFLHGDQPVYSFDQNGKGNRLPTNSTLEHDDALCEVELGLPYPERIGFFRRLDAYIEKLASKTVKSDRAL